MFHWNEPYHLSSHRNSRFLYAKVRAAYLNGQWAQFKQNYLGDIAYSIKAYVNIERILWQFILLHLDLKMVSRCDRDVVLSYY